MDHAGPFTADEITWALQPPSDDPPDDDLLTAVLIEAQGYRLVAQQAIHTIYALTQDLNSLRAQVSRLHGESRRVRESLLWEGA